MRGGSTARLLGLEEIPKPEPLLPEGGVWFACGAQQLHVGASRTFRAERKGHPAFAVADGAALARVAEALVLAGTPVKWDDRLAGVERFYTEDPWGNRLELLARGAAAPGEDAERPER